MTSGQATWKILSPSSQWVSRLWTALVAATLLFLAYGFSHLPATIVPQSFEDILSRRAIEMLLIGVSLAFFLMSLLLPSLLFNPVVDSHDYSFWLSRLTTTKQDRHLRALSDRIRLVQWYGQALSILLMATSFLHGSELGLYLSLTPAIHLFLDRPSKEDPRVTRLRQKIQFVASERGHGNPGDQQIRLVIDNEREVR